MKKLVLIMAIVFMASTALGAVTAGDLYTFHAAQNPLDDEAIQNLGSLGGAMMADGTPPALTAAGGGQPAYYDVDGGGGSFDILSVGAGNLDLDAAFSYEMYVRRTAHDQGDSGETQVSAAFEGGGSEMFVQLYGSGHGSSDTAIDMPNLQNDIVDLPLNTWVHWIATFDDATDAFKVYVDGANTIDTTSFAYDLNVTGSNDVTLFKTRGSEDDGRRFPGDISYARLYDTVLTAGEVTDNYNARLDVPPVPPVVVLPGKRWNVAGPADWAVGTNWTDNVAPNAEDTLVRNGGTAEISSAVNAITRLTIGGGSTVVAKAGGSLDTTAEHLEITNGTLRVEGGDVEIQNAWDLRIGGGGLAEVSSGILTVDDDIWTSGGGTFRQTGGTVLVGDDIGGYPEQCDIEIGGTAILTAGDKMENDGQWSISGSNATITGSEYEQTDSATLAVELDSGGTSPITSSGDLNIDGGALNVTTSEAVPNGVYDVLVGASPMSPFDTVSLPAGFALSYEYELEGANVFKVRLYKGVAAPPPLKPAAPAPMQFGKQYMVIGTSDNAGGDAIYEVNSDGTLTFLKNIAGTGAPWNNACRTARYDEASDTVYFTDGNDDIEFQVGLADLLDNGLAAASAGVTPGWNANGAESKPTHLVIGPQDGKLYAVAGGAGWMWRFEDGTPDTLTKMTTGTVAGINHTLVVYGNTAYMKDGSDDFFCWDQNPDGTWTEKYDGGPTGILGAADLAIRQSDGMYFTGRSGTVRFGYIDTAVDPTQDLDGEMWKLDPLGLGGNDYRSLEVSADGTKLWVGWGNALGYYDISGDSYYWAGNGSLWTTVYNAAGIEGVPDGLLGGTDWRVSIVKTPFVVPEPAGLGLIGLALLAVRRRRS